METNDVGMDKTLAANSYWAEFMAANGVTGVHYTIFVHQSNGPRFPSTILRSARMTA